jgi:primosomal protein N' (replication factor Y)
LSEQLQDGEVKSPSLIESETVADSVSQASGQLAAQVAIPGLPTTLSYRLTPLADDASGSANLVMPGIGFEVKVELGNRIAAGWIVGLADLNQAQGGLHKAKSTASSNGQAPGGKASQQLALISSAPSDLRLKPIISAAPSFLPDQLPLFEWMAEYYGVPIADVIESAIPLRAELKPKPAYVLTQKGRELAADTETMGKLFKSAKLRARLIERLARSELPLLAAELSEESKSPAATLRRLAEDGIVEIKSAKMELAHNPTAHPNSLGGGAPEFLTPGQEKALEVIRASIAAKKFDPILLLGVTGSGKTEVYLRAIIDVLASGGSVLVIVPEIALTPQLFDRFSSRLGAPLAMLHSQVGTTARWAAWQALLGGRLRVALGARSAVFAPVKDLSLVVVDEEHESSYKQSDSLRYHARDVAVMRAKIASCPVVLGSATPSFESLLNVRKGRYKLVEMTERATRRPVPSIEIVDLKNIKRKEMPAENVSPQLKAALDQTLSKGEQAVIMYNRRGFASYLQCGTCNEVVSCPNCSVALTFHRGRSKLLCHYCGLTLPVLRFCPICRNPKTTRDERPESAKRPPELAGSTVLDLKELEDETLTPAVSPSAQADPVTKESKPLPERSNEKEVGILFHRGSGTERVVDELARLYPAARIIRMDRDTVGHKDAYREILGKMRSGEADILVGTQMIAKGHDLPGVTLVGIIDADVGLHLPDFRASEKIYQLITQAAGRAGRGEEPGRVLVQTREASHPTIVATVTGRFKAFARYELEYRTALNYPPAGRLLRLVISATRPASTAQIAAAVSEAASQFIQRRIDSAAEAPKVSILGPAVAPLEKLLARYRWHILIKSSSAKLLSGVAADLHNWSRTRDLPDGGRVAVDVDPYDML